MYKKPNSSYRKLLAGCLLDSASITTPKSHSMGKPGRQTIQVNSFHTHCIEAVLPLCVPAVRDSRSKPIRISFQGPLPDLLCISTPRPLLLVLAYLCMTFVVISPTPFSINLRLIENKIMICCSTILDDKDCTTFNIINHNVHSCFTDMHTTEVSQLLRICCHQRIINSP